MNNDMSSYFEDPEFKDLLAKFEGMVESHTPTYFDAEELTDIAEYYATQGEEQKAEEVIDYALRLHPNNTDALALPWSRFCPVAYRTDCPLQTSQIPKHLPCLWILKRIC